MSSDPVRLPRPIAIAVALIVSTLLIGVVEVWPRLFSAADTRSHSVTYRVDGDGPVVVSYAATAGSKLTKASVTLPWSLSLQIKPEAPALYAVTVLRPMPDTEAHSTKHPPVLPNCSITLDGVVVPSVVATAYNQRECSYRP